jgi:hypothetical protein
MGAARKEWAPGEYEAASVAAAVGSDTTRAHLCKPFGAEMHGRGFIVATDGHRLHAVASEAWSKYARHDAPPAAAVIPWDSKLIGEITPQDAWRFFPAKWDASITFTPGTVTGWLRASVLTGSGKKERIVNVIGGEGGAGGRGGIPVEWMKSTRSDFAPVSVALHYLADAVDFVGTGAVHVWGGKRSEDPLVFTPTPEPAAAAARFAVVMPRRL